MRASLNTVSSFKVAASNNRSCLLGVQIACVFENARHVLVEVQGYQHLPASRKHLRIVDRHFVTDSVRGDAREALGQLQRVAVEIAGMIEPRLSIEADR